jgi:hypothetical protein
VHFKKALDLKPDYARAQYGIVKAYVQLADVRPENNKKLDVELARLRKLDAKLAAEMAQYRKTYTGDLIAVPPPSPVKTGHKRHKLSRGMGSGIMLLV